MLICSIRCFGVRRNAESKSIMGQLCVLLIYAGIFYSASVFGPVVAYICGGFLLKLYTHFDSIDTSL